jgi:inosine-uridine nucleoside N-ribohydrolase
LRRVWVDTDVALGAAAGDVDDGFALAALAGAAALGRIELAGVSTVDGNTSAVEAERCARARLEAAGSPGVVPVHRAAAAARAIAALPDESFLVAIGPLANVAAALELDPGLAARTRLRVVGGNLTSRGFLPPLWPHEFNLAKGGRAARAVLNAPWRELVVHPLDVLRRFRCDAARIERLSSAGRVGALLADGSRRWLARSRWRHGTGGFPVWDLVPALEVSGALAVRVEERTFPLPQRLAFGIPERIAALTDFDPEEAWRGFAELVLRPRS